jgi:hypothetical protein
VTVESTSRTSGAGPTFFENVHINDFDDIDLGHVTGPTDLQDRGKSVWIRSMLAQVFSLEANKCIAAPTKEDVNTGIRVKREGGVKIMSLD